MLNGEIMTNERSGFPVMPCRTGGLVSIGMRSTGCTGPDTLPSAWKGMKSSRPNDAEWGVPVGVSGLAEVPHGGAAGGHKTGARYGQQFARRARGCRTTVRERGGPDHGAVQREGRRRDADHRSGRTRGEGGCGQGPCDGIRQGVGTHRPDELKHGDWAYSAFGPNGNPLAETFTTCRACPAPPVTKDCTPRLDEWPARNTR